MEEEEAEATPALVAHGAAGGWARLALLYGAVSAVFCVAVGHRLLRARLRPGVRAACSLLLLFMGEPLCAAFAPGAPGLLAFALACLLSYATLPFTASLPAAGRAVLIVGCESAASHVLARRLAELGCRVFVGVRASSHAEAGRIAGDLAPDPSGDPASGRPGPVHVLGLKPGDPRSVTAAEKEVRSLVGADGLWGLVVVAAADGRAPCGVGMLSEVPDVGAYRRGLERGLLAPMELAGVFLPLVRRACGRVVFVGPGAAVEAPAGGPQAVAAAALAAFCVALRGRLGSEGTHVCGVEVPGGCAGSRCQIPPAASGTLSVHAAGQGRLRRPRRRPPKRAHQRAWPRRWRPCCPSDPLRGTRCPAGKASSATRGLSPAGRPAWRRDVLGAHRRFTNSYCACAAQPPPTRH
ncbi:17-beta-hydroxysteroid dehydrogenase type 2-like isoform X1 [Lampetra fluviatilis]